MSTVAIKDLGSAGGEFDYHLPGELIAQHPLPQRTSSRLLHLTGDSGKINDLGFPDIVDLLQGGDLLVFNDTKVVPARLYGRKSTGGRVELLLERVVDEHTILALAGSSKPLRPGHLLILEKDGDRTEAAVMERHQEHFVIRFTDCGANEVLERLGHVPLPPYILRQDLEEDRDRYQTVYARSPGAVAAPTAGLHFDEPLLEALRGRDVQCAFLTLHVGAGTFQPIRTPNPLDHRMHPERVRVPNSVVEAVAAAKRRGNRVVAVGTRF